MKPIAWAVPKDKTLEAHRAECPHHTLVADADYDPVRYYCGDCGQDLGNDMTPLVKKPEVKAERKLEPPPPDDFDQEEVYDTKLFPLMEQIIAICKEARISVNATFVMDPPGTEDAEDTMKVKTHVPRLDREESFQMALMRFAQSADGNLDAVVFAAARWARENGRTHESVVLSLLGSAPGGKP